MNQRGEKGFPPPKKKILVYIYLIDHKRKTNMEKQILNTWADVIVKRFMPTDNYNGVDNVDDCYNQEYCEDNRPKIKELKTKRNFLSNSDFVIPIS